MNVKPLNDYYIFTEKEDRLIYNIFESDAGEELLKLWEQKVLNRMVADPAQGAEWAFFKQGQTHILNGLSLSYQKGAAKKNAGKE